MSELSEAAERLKNHGYEPGDMHELPSLKCVDLVTLANAWMAEHSDLPITADALRERGFQSEPESEWIELETGEILKIAEPDVWIVHDNECCELSNRVHTLGDLDRLLSILVPRETLA